MNNDIKYNVKRVMSAVFEIPVEQIDNKSSSNNIKSWDSLKHINLVIALEDEFNIQFLDKEIIQLSTYCSIISILNKKVS